MLGRGGIVWRETRGITTDINVFTGIHVDLKDDFRSTAWFVVFVAAFLQGNTVGRNGLYYRAGCFRNRGISKKRIILEGKEVSTSGINIYFFQRKRYNNSDIHKTREILIFL